MEESVALVLLLEEEKNKRLKGIQKKAIGMLKRIAIRKKETEEKKNSKERQIKI